MDLTRSNRPADILTGRDVGTKVVIIAAVCIIRRPVLKKVVKGRHFPVCRKVSAILLLETIVEDV